MKPSAVEPSQVEPTEVEPTEVEPNTRPQFTLQQADKEEPQITSQTFNMRNPVDTERFASATLKPIEEKQDFSPSFKKTKAGQSTVKYELPKFFFPQRQPATSSNTPKRQGPMP